ncbi:hypothetical protein D3C72_2201100 [compost metagenome]
MEPLPLVAWRACWPMLALADSGTMVSGDPPLCARIWMRQADSSVYMVRKASDTVRPHVSKPWLRRIICLQRPRSATSRAFSSSRKATPS